MKTCRVCSVEKPECEFAKSNAAKDGLHSWCKLCKASRSRDWWKNNKARENAKDRAAYASDGTRQRRQALEWYARNKATAAGHKWRAKLKVYGLTPEDYDRMFSAQGGCCAICGGTTRHAVSRTLAVDHDHRTGDIRGLLCHHCNVGIGHFSDDPDRLEAAAAYLRQSARRNAA